MIYNALIIELDEDVEEAVLLEVRGIQMKCFASSCPYPVDVGSWYPVEFKLTVFDKYQVDQVKGGQGEEIRKLNGGFSYEIIGRINCIGFESMGVVFSDDFLAKEYSYLKGYLVALKVDRLDVEFVDRLVFVRS